MFSITTQANKPVQTVKPTQNQQNKQTQSKQQLSHDIVQIQEHGREEVFAQAQKLLDQAEALPVPEVKLLGINKALKKLKTQADKESDSTVQAKQEQALEELLKENAEIRKKLDDPKPANNPNYPRPVSQVELTLVDHLLQDLAHPDAEMAKQAHARLKKLGVSEDLLHQIAHSLKLPKSKHSVTFSGGSVADNINTTNPAGQHNLLEEARNQIFANSSPTQVINTGVEHHLETVRHATNPVHFGGGGYYPIGHDHNGYPMMEWSNNLY